jgi:hypothetical protein
MKSKTSHQGEMIVPPFSGVALVEYRDHITLTPTYACREFVGLGKLKASEIKPDKCGYFSSMVYKHWGDREVWVVVRWERYDDGREEPTFMIAVDPDATEAEARKQFDGMVDFCNLSKKELEELGECFEQTEEALTYIRKRFPDLGPNPKITGKTEKERLEQIEQNDLYQARLKVLAGMAPKTVTLMQEAYATEDRQKREKLEHEAVQAYFAELSQDWSEEQVLVWQRNNPVGTKWLCEFARVLSEPQRDLDPINHELVLNWIRKGYNLLTAEELSDAILIMTGQRLLPDTLKRRRARLGLTTRRARGPKTKLELLKSKLKHLF